MPTRYYDFTSSFDQTTAPTGSTPSADADFVTILYGSTHYARFIDSVANLKAVAAASRTDQLPIFVKALQAWFYFDSASVATGDDENIITPTAGSGRWLRVPLKGFGGVQNVATSATIAAMASSTPVVRLTGSTITDLQGITAGVGEQLLAIYNASSVEVTLKHENVTASAANRLSLQQARDVTIKAGGATMLRYDKTLTRWVPAGGAGGGGGGGGGSSLEWTIDTNGPLPDYGFFQNLFKFIYGEDQQLYAVYPVPLSYSVGGQIKMAAKVTSPDTSTATLHFKTQTTLIAAGDHLNSTTNQRTSTNAELNLTVLTSDRALALECDLTDADGKINSVSVSPGDILIIRLYRDDTVATSTVPASFLPKTSEVFVP